MWSYAHKNDYVRDNKVTYLQTKGNGTRSTIHYRFSADELDVLWAHEGHDTADFLLLTRDSLRLRFNDGEQGYSRKY